MNKDKAIQLLERLQDPDPYEPQITSEAFDALQMAIDALSADGNTISRQAAMKACGGYLVPASIIKELPSAEPRRIKGHWICDRSWSDGVGMGESYGHYWKCDKCGHLEQGDWGECGCNFCSNCGSDNREVTT